MNIKKECTACNKSKKIIIRNFSSNKKLAKILNEYKKDIKKFDNRADPAFKQKKLLTPTQRRNNMLSFYQNVVRVDFAPKSNEESRLKFQRHILNETKLDIEREKIKQKIEENKNKNLSMRFLRESKSIGALRKKELVSRSKLLSKDSISPIKPNFKKKTVSFARHDDYLNESRRNIKRKNELERFKDEIHRYDGKFDENPSHDYRVTN